MSTASGTLLAWLYDASVVLMPPDAVDSLPFFGLTPWNVMFSDDLIGNPGCTLSHVEPGATCTVIFSLPAVTGYFVANESKPVQFVSEAWIVKLFFLVADGVTNRPGLDLKVAPGGFFNGPVPMSHVGEPPDGIVVEVDVDVDV